MALLRSVTREQAPSTPDLRPLLSHTSQPPTLALLNGALYFLCCLRSLQEMSSCWKFFSHGNKYFWERVEHELFSICIFRTLYRPGVL